MESFIIFLIGGHKIEIDVEQYKKVLQQMNGGAKMIAFAETGQAIMVHSISYILPKGQIQDDEETRLGLNGLFKCQGGRTHSMGDRDDPYRMKCDCPRKSASLVSPELQKLLSNNINKSWE